MFKLKYKINLFEYFRSGQKWLNWIKYISWFYYANESAIINQWTDVTNLPCTNLAEGQPCYQNGDAVLNLVDYNKVKKKRNFK
jgi:hypothetical protein